MSLGPHEPEMKWGYAFAGVLAVGFAAVIQFVFGDLNQEGIDNLPAILAVAYSAAGKIGLTIPLAVIGAALVVFDVWRSLKRRRKARAARRRNPNDGVATTALSAADAAAAPAPDGKIRGGYHLGASARRGNRVNTTEEGQEVVPDGGVVLGPIDPGKGGGRVKLATERYMNWGKRPE